MSFVTPPVKPFHRIDLENVPRSALIENPVYEQILLELKERFLELIPEDDRAYFAEALKLESEPLVIQFEERAYREVYLVQRKNEAIAALMLANASGTDLDALGANPPWCVYRLEGEDDNRFKERIVLAVASTSSAGSVADYRFYALSADVRLLDCFPISHTVGSGIVDLYLLTPNDATASEITANVEKAVSPDDVRPLTDKVRVQPAEITRYKVNARLWLYDGPDKNTVYTYALTKIKALVQMLFKFGHDIHHSAIIAGLKVAGVQRVELVGWDDLIIQGWQAARCTDINIEVVGRDE